MLLFHYVDLYQAVGYDVDSKSAANLEARKLSAYSNSIPCIFRQASNERKNPPERTISAASALQSGPVKVK